MRLFHFSEDPTIERFVPHVPRTNPTQPARVWAIDEEHQAAYWFPRDCPRVTVWCNSPGDLATFRERFGTGATRLHAAEERWRSVMWAATLYRYELPAEPFRPWEEADGQWIADTPMEPLGVEPFDDLIGRHRSAGVELRFVDSLWPLRDEVASSDWPFSIIRMMYATAR